MRTIATDRETLREAILAEVRPTLKQLKAATSQRILQCGASMTHLHVLWFLEDHDGTPMSRIAEHMDVSLSNASGLIDRMEERGFVERLRVPDDRRVVLVRVTDRGRELLARVDVLRSEALNGLTERLDDVQLQRLYQTISDLKAAAAADLNESSNGITSGKGPGQS